MDPELYVVRSSGSLGPSFFERVLPRSEAKSEDTCRIDLRGAGQIHREKIKRLTLEQREEENLRNAA